MNFKSLIVIFTACVFAVLAGCGGGGVDDADLDPSGAFTMSMSSSTDGSFTGRQFAIEMDASKGKIISAFARLIPVDVTGGHTTTQVTGSAESGFVDLVAQFDPFRVELEAEHNGLSWNGHYTVWDGKELLDEGEIEVSRADSTMDIAGSWEGEIDLGNEVVTANLQFIQDGNEIAILGTVGGKAQIGDGSIIGRSVHFEIRNDNDAGWPNYLGTVSSGGLRMTGANSYSSFELEKVGAR